MTALSFDYRAVDKFGKIRRGITSAPSQADAYRRLLSLGLVPVRLEPAADGPLGTRRSKRVKLGQLAHFTYQLGVLVSARIPISEGLVSIAQQEQEPRMREIITDLARRIESGEQLAIAMDHHRGALGDVYIEAVRAAERSGNLPRVLEHLSDMLERSLETVRMVRSALMYPICVVSVLTLAVVFLVSFVVPKFAKMFQSRGQKLPVFTEALMALGQSVQDFWYLYLVLIGGTIFGVRWAWRNQELRPKIDALLHKVPYLKSILVGLAISRFCRIFGVSLASGLGMLESLDLAGKASGRPLLQRDVARMVAQVRTGGRLTDVLAGCGYLTAFAKRMLAAGEQSAELSKMCGVVSRHYDRETGHLTKNIGTVIEPVLIVGIAVMVLVIALAIFLPMWDMIKIVG
jgi:type II secretory pathway component PulF